MLESNEPVVDPHLTNIYTRAKQDKKWLEDNIHYIKNQLLSSLEENLAHVETVVAEHAVVLSPIRTLPTELLVHIMSLSLGLGDPNNLLDLTTSAFRLAQVSKRFRSIALDTPALWSNVTIDLRNREHFLQPMFYNVPNILQLYVERSKTLPLTISFASDSNTDLTGRILRTMLNCRSRWRNITLDVSSKAVDGTISRSLTDIPLLESLGINISFLKFIRPTRVDITLFQNAPCLKTVSLFGASAFTHREAVHFHAALPGGGALPGWPFAAPAPPAIIAPAPPPFTFGIAGPLANPALTLHASIPAVPSPRDISPRLPLPWKQLSTLDIEFAAYGDFFPVLAQTPNVVTCHLESEILTRTHPHDMITLPKLRSLRLSGTAVYALQGLLAPGLKSLVIENTEQPGSGREERFILPFIQASSCALQHLSFQSIPMTEHVLGILRGTPTLSGLNLDLYLKHPRDSAQFGALISALTYVNLQEILLPKLKDLSLSVYSKSGLPTRALVDMVKSRRKVSVAMDEQNARLEHLYLKANCGWSPPFDELKEDRGLKTDLVLR